MKTYVAKHRIKPIIVYSGAPDTASSEAIVPYAFVDKNDIAIYSQTIDNSLIVYKNTDPYGIAKYTQAYKDIPKRVEVTDRNTKHNLMFDRILLNGSRSLQEANERLAADNRLTTYVPKIAGDRGHEQPDTTDIYGRRYIDSMSQFFIARKKLLGNFTTDIEKRKQQLRAEISAQTNAYGGQTIDRYIAIPEDFAELNSPTDIFPKGVLPTKIEGNVVVKLNGITKESLLLFIDLSVNTMLGNVRVPWNVSVLSRTVTKTSDKYDKMTLGFVAIVDPGYSRAVKSATVAFTSDSFTLNYNNESEYPKHSSSIDSIYITRACSRKLPAYGTVREIPLACGANLE